MEEQNPPFVIKYRLILVSIALAAICWVLDSMLSTILLQHEGVINQALPQVNVDVLRRSATAIFIIGLGICAHHVFRRRNELTLESGQQEFKFQRLVELLPDAIAIQNEARIVYVNPSGRLLFGPEDNDELHERSVWDFIPQEYKKIVEARCRRMQDEGIKAPPVEVELSCLDGRKIDVEMTAIPFTFDRKPVTLMIFHDITTRKWVEEEIRQRNIELAALNTIAETVSQSLNLETILNDALDGIVQLDMLGGDAQGMIFLQEERSDTLRLVAQRGAPEDHPCLKNPPKVGECLCGLAVQTGKPVLSEDGHTDVRHSRNWPNMPHHKDVCLPLKVRGSVLGAMDVRLPGEKDISDNIVKLLTSVAGQVGVAIENGRLFEELRQQRNKLRILGTRLAETEDAERRRLARELHDQVGEGLTALGINLNIIRKQFTGERPERLYAYLDESLALVDKTTERIRDVMADLRPPMLDEYGLLATLRWYAERFGRRSGIKTVAFGDEPDPRLPEIVENALFRIAVEALTNVAKHAHASRVTIRLDEAEETIQLNISDDGNGFNVDRTVSAGTDQGWGMLTMTERAEAIGGRFRIESDVTNGGTQVIVELDK